MFWNQAGSFSGTQPGYISFPHSSSPDITGAFTLECWINPSNSSSPAF